MEGSLWPGRAFRGLRLWRNPPRRLHRLEAHARLARWCRKVGGKLENWRKLLIVKHSERRCAAAERSLRHETSYGIDVAQSIFR